MSASLQSFNMNTLANIMIIGEDKELLKEEQFYLIKEGFNVVVFQSIIDVEQNLEAIHLIILDCDLSTINGIDFIQYLRQKNIDTPIIVLNQKATPQEVEKAFLHGADDHLVKPFNMNELVYRTKALLKRTHGLKHERLSYKNILLDINSRTTYLNGKEVELTKLEFNLLEFFIQHKNMILEREYILDSVWKDNSTKNRTINVSINPLIKKIDPENSYNYFTAIRGIGYKFE